MSINCDEGEYKICLNGEAYTKDSILEEKEEEKFTLKQWEEIYRNAEEMSSVMDMTVKESINNLIKVLSEFKEK